MTLTPKQELLFNSITAIDDQYIEEAICEISSRTPIFLRRVAAIAAVISILFGCLFFPSASNVVLLNEGSFIVSASASNGFQDDLSSWKEQFINRLASSTAPGFPTTQSRFSNKDTFKIFISPSSWDKSEDISFFYNLRVYYGNTTVLRQDQDQHVDWGFLVPTATAPPGSVSQFLLIGWFYEPIDLRIEILDKDNTLVQEQTIHITYNSLTRSYKLEVTDFKLYTEGE